VPRGAKSRMRRTETPEPIWIKFCTVVEITDVVTHTNFGDHRLRGFWEAGVKFPPFPLTFFVVLTTLSRACDYASVHWHDVGASMPIRRVHRMRIVTSVGLHRQKKTYE